MPIATPQRTRVALAPRDDARVRAWSANVGNGDAPIEYRLGAEARTGGWGDYLAGVTAALAAAGHAFGGFDARVESDVPLGAGLSSSASLEVALIRALQAAFGMAIDPVAIAKVAQRAETDLVGAPVGIMDQMAASLADQDAALFLDTQTLAYERLPLPPGTGLIVMHSGITHSHAGGEYGVRRAECDEGARRLGVRSLREVSEAQLAAMTLPPPLDRRVRHVVTENARVLEARDALARSDASALGALMQASHAS